MAAGLLGTPRAPDKFRRWGDAEVSPCRATHGNMACRLSPAHDERFSVTRIFLVCLLAFCVNIPSHAADEWPPHVVAIEEMKPLRPLRMGVPKVRVAGEVTGPVVLRAHVDTEGKVRRVALLESCGSPAHDEAALHTARSMLFAPKLVDGVATDVTLVVPFHLPLSKKSAPSP